MLIAYQVILMILTLFFSLSLIGEQGKNANEDKNRYVSIVLASVISLVVTFVIGV